MKYITVSLVILSCVVDCVLSRLQFDQSVVNAISDEAIWTSLEERYDASENPSPVYLITGEFYD